jgi:antitoxin component YwqK of YwqJK toxin-antitoxin module
MRRYYLIVCLLFLGLSTEAQESFVKKNFYDRFDKIIKDVITLRKKDSLPQGKYQSYFQSGSLESKGFYSSGEIDSLWTFYYQNGRKKAFGQYANGFPKGLWKYYFESGRIKSEGQLSNEKKIGLWNYYFENGKTKSSGKYDDGKKTGIWNYFYEDESIKAQAFYDLKSADYKEFHPNGSLKSAGTIVDDQSAGLWTYYYESGEKEASGEFDQGLRTGFWQYFHKNYKVSAEGKFLEGYKNGIWKYYHADGSLSGEGAMKQNAKDGFWKLFHPTGELKGEANYNTGTGSFKEYYPGGQIQVIGNIENGEKEGLWKYYSETGILEGEADFQKGKGLYTGFYHGGVVKMQGTIEQDRRIGDWSLYNTDGSIAGTYRPVYEELNPIFRTGEIIENQKIRESKNKPDYRFKSNELRYFEPVINEYVGIIMGTNPLWTLTGRLPLAVEYYRQERMGYEVIINIHKDPFYKKSSNLNTLEIGTNGVSINLRQKFYNTDGKLGMFYFGHDVQAGFLHHQVTSEDVSDILLTSTLTKYEAKQHRFAYSLLIGNRWMQRANDSGVTLDLHIGIGVGRRDFELQYEPSPNTSGLFDNINRDQFYVPLIIGVNVGFAGPKRRSTSF